MNTNMDLMTDEIQNAFLRCLETGLVEYEQVRSQSYIERYPEADLLSLDWMDRGCVLFRIDMRIFGNNIAYKAKSYNYQSNPDSDGNISYSSTTMQNAYYINELSQSEKTHLFEIIFDFVQEFIKSDERQIFAPIMEFSMGFEPFEKQDEARWDARISKVFSFDGAQQWLESQNELSKSVE